MRDDDSKGGSAVAAPGGTDDRGIGSDPARILRESRAGNGHVADRAARDAVARATPEDWRHAWNAGRTPGGSRGIETRADALFVLRDTGVIKDDDSEEWDRDRKGTDEMVGLARIASHARAQVLEAANEEHSAAAGSLARETFRIAVDNTRTDSELHDRHRADRQTIAAGAALSEIQHGLSKIAGNIARTSDPTAKTLLQSAYADLTGALADLTGDPELSARYGQGARQIRVGAQDLAVHGERFRERFGEMTDHLRQEAARVGIDLQEVGARLSLGRAVTAGQVRDWDDSDFSSVLGKAGKTLDSASPEDLDKASGTLERFNQKVLDTYAEVVATVREEVQAQIRRSVGRDDRQATSLAEARKMRGAGHARAQRHDEGISL